MDMSSIDSIGMDSYSAPPVQNVQRQKTTIEKQVRFNNFFKKHFTNFFF